MRRVVLLSLIFLVSTLWAVAQYDSADNEKSDTTPATNHVTIVGCLAGGDGNFTLTDEAGAIYQLTGNTAKLSGHVGHTLRVTGVSTSVLHPPGSMSEGTERHPTLSVDSFKHIRSNCDETTGSGAY